LRTGEKNRWGGGKARTRERDDRKRKENKFPGMRNQKKRIDRIIGRMHLTTVLSKPGGQGEGRGYGREGEDRFKGAKDALTNAKYR